MLKLFIFVAVLIGIEAEYLEENFPATVIEDGKLDTAQLLKKYNYPCETHYVTTEDKYILRVHRLANPNRPPVFLMHGLLDSSATWILMGPWSALGYLLYDEGYDVWMGNARGNRYSRNHTIFNPDIDKSFWKFSFHEIGYYDLPAMLDYVLKQTGYSKLNYFGHSQGTTSFFIMCSMRPEYNNKVNLMHALAPVAFMRYIKTPLVKIFGNFLVMSKDMLTEFMPHNEITVQLCFRSKTAVDTCLDSFYQAMGRETKQMNMTMLPAIMGHVPAGCTFRQLVHYVQLTGTDRFCQYDYGPVENMKRYGSILPTDYALHKITTRVVLNYAQNDYLSSEIDVQRLAKILPNVVEDNMYPSKNWNHMTMLWGMDAREMTHRHMIQLMRRYE